MPQLVAPGSEAIRDMIREEIGRSEARVVKEMGRRWKEVDGCMGQVREVMVAIMEEVMAGQDKVRAERKENLMRSRGDVEVFRGMRKAMDGLRGQLDELVVLVEANSEMAEGVRGAQQHFEREVRGLRTQVVAGVDSMVRTVDVVKKEVRGCGQMVGRMGEKVEGAVGCVQADSCAQLGRVEARVGEVEWAVREQWDVRHRELVAQVRSLARGVEAAGRSRSGPPQGFVAAGGVEWGIRPGFTFKLGREGLGYYRSAEVVEPGAVGGSGRGEMGCRGPRKGGERVGKGKLRSEDRREGVQYFAVPLTSK
jgi:hypothetical protein